MNAPLHKKSSSRSAPELGLGRFDHVELFVGNARQAAAYYTSAFGFTCVAYRGLETGARDAATYVLEQGRIRLLLTSALGAEHPAGRWVSAHGDGVAVIAVEVDDVAVALEAAAERGAQVVAPLRVHEDGQGRQVRTGAIGIYGETRLRFVQRAGYDGLFMPGFEPCTPALHARNDAGLRAIDHIVGNVEVGAMQRWADFFAGTLGFHELRRFDRETISTEYSALQSVVMQDPSGRLKFPINEPAEGRRRSQIAEFLDFHAGPGVQHLALATADIITTVSRLRDNGVKFLRVPPAYYEALTDRVGGIREPVQRLAELGILVDRDHDGYLLQIFTEPVADRPTLFYEIIQRRGARGFGEGNFKSLFEAIEREQNRRGNL